MTEERNSLEGATFRDRSLEYQEQQEKKRLAFEADQEQKRQKFEQKIEQAKARRDVMMLIITFAAVTAAYWTGWEARHARLEAAAIAENSSKIQRDAVKAQNLATQLEQRSYVRVTPVGIAVHSSQFYGSGYYEGRFKITSEGKTPAINFQVSLQCGVSQANQKEQFVEASFFISTFVSVAHSSTVAYNGEVFDAEYPFPLKEYREIKNTIKDISVEDKNQYITFIVTVTYHDVFEKYLVENPAPHHTQQCFVLPSGVAHLENAKLASCSSFQPVID